MKLFFIKSIIIFALLTLATQQAWSHDIKRIGSFSNFKFTAEHQYGTSIELWQEGENIFGILSSAEGLAGDIPTGLLENISFDKKTGKISFTAKLSIGIHGCSVHNDIPSRNFFTFNGIIRKTTIIGVLKRFDALHSDSKEQTSKINLKREKNEYFIEYKDRDEWESQMKIILQRLVPKW